MIDVVIPYASKDGKVDKNLGAEYNRIMEKADRPVLFLDQDVYVSLNPNWYQMCMDAVKQLKKDRWGWITCLTNKIGCPHQRVEIGPQAPDDISFHRGIAADLWKPNVDSVRKWHPEEWEANGDKTAWPSGFFLLTNPEAWKAAGGFKDGHQGVDNDYARKLVGAGYEIWQMTGLYVYHRYDRIYKW